MTKLIIQIPCYNEAEALPVTLASLPRRLPGIDEIEWLVIDDGSVDGTASVAREHGVDHVVRLPRNQGLSRAFVAGLEACLAEGADIIVNTDADNQYRSSDIPRLVAPILAGEAEIVIGERPIADTTHFSPAKKLLQKIGSWVVRRVSGTSVRDAPSGFRAMSRQAAMQLHVFNDYSYTLETIIQAGRKGMAVVSVPIATNEELRPSRLFSSLWDYISRQLLIIFRIFVTYNPFIFFAVPGTISFGIGFLIGLRFLVDYLTTGGLGHVQSLILAALLMGAGCMLIVVGLLADLISVNRKLLEALDWRLHRIEDRLGEESREKRLEKIL
jgi:glycosyltransferase involved in cell wall biosynthesis